MNSKILIWSFFFICLLSGPAAGADNAESADKPKADSPLLRKTIFGLGLHDTGPISDKQENGVDPNWELQFNPPGWKWWRWIGSPYTIVGVTANFNGATSQVYAAFNYEVSLSNKYTDPWTFNLTKYLFVSVALGPAIHNGPLKKNEDALQANRRLRIWLSHRATALWRDRRLFFEKSRCLRFRRSHVWRCSFRSIAE